MPTSLEKLQSLLRELFQFELSDLDFGIYRLFRLKKDELDKFIGEQIPAAAARAFGGITAADRSAIALYYDEVKAQVLEEFGQDSLDAKNELTDAVRATSTMKSARKLIGKYDDALARRREAGDIAVNEDDVFNHLHAFFSRYYDRGDFIARRFFGARPRYAVPYNGEETHFHWANKDQHYIKSGEAFRDYSFTVADILGGPARVRFALTKASVPPGDTKGDRRYFFPQPDESKWDPASRTFTIGFHFRLPVEAELKSAPVEENGAAGENGDAAAGDGNGENGKAAKPKKISGDKLQEKLLADALDALIAACPEAGLADALRKVVNQEEVGRDGKPPVTCLAKRMRHFARRQTSDYFVHKNLAAFLREELDFYIKDQVIHVADLEGDFEGKRRMLRALRELAGQLIAFLHQIEEVQRRLFEKRKFVLRTDYLCPVQNVPRALWKEICANQRQLAEWVDLYALGQDGAGDDDLFAFKGRLTESFLENHPTLVVNTALFDEDFKWRLLESFDDLDAVTDGVLVKSENYQALQLVARWLHERVQCIYIDPPYNTGKDGFIYKDSYRHSTWLAMMQQRLEVAHALLSRDGALLCSIGDQELPRILELGEHEFGEQNHAVTFIWNTDGNIDNQSKIKQNHEYVATFACNIGELPAPAVIDPNVGEESKLFKDTIENTIVKNGPGNPESEIVLPIGFPADFEEGEIVPGTAEFPKFKHPVKVKAGKLTKPLAISSGWSSSELLDEFIQNGMQPINDSKGQVTRFFVKQTGAPYVVKERSSEQGHVLSVLRGMGSTQSMAGQLRGMGLSFDYPKPVGLIQFLTAAFSSTDSTVVDFFGGSGTTAEAAINLTRENGKRRRFVLIEVADYFDTIVLPRVKKVIFTPSWKDGKPTRLPTKDEATRTPRLVKVLRLESYEDALHNLATDATLAASEAKAAAFQGALGAESYRLNYIARLPMEANPSMLQTARLDHPFRYSLEILTDDGAEARTVDLVETFNWLLGLDVQRVRRWQHEKRDYLAVLGRDRANKRLLVVWRDTADLDPRAERVFLEKQVATLTKDAPFDRMLINGDSATPGFETLDGLFKQLMEAD